MHSRRGSRAATHGPANCEQLLGFPGVHLEWLDGDGSETPTVAAGVNEARIVVYETVP